MKKITHILGIALLFTGITPSYAGGPIPSPCISLTGGPCSDFLTQLVGNASEAGSFANSTVQTGVALGSKLKEFSLDPIAAKIANNLINRALNDTATWMKSGFQGGGPAFIVNPDAYFKNVANQEIRIQLDSINKSNNPNKSAIATALIQNVRTERAGVGATLNSNLLSTVQSETCTPQNLAKIAAEQVDSGLSTNINDTNLSRAQKIENKKQELSQTFCTSASLSDKNAQAKLQACFQSGSCGGTASTLAAFDPINTIYGASMLGISKVDIATQKAVETQRSKTSGGLIPKEVCKVRLTADSDDTPYPEGEGPCVEWQIETPVDIISEKAKQLVTGNFGKINNVQGFGDLLGGLAESFLTNQANALYKNLASSISDKGGSGSLNLTYDNLLGAPSRALPAEILPKETTNDNTPVSAQITKAEKYCADQPEAKKQSLSQICKHIESIKKTNTVDKKYITAGNAYLASVSRLKTCSEKAGGEYDTKVIARQSKFESFGDTDEVKKRITLYIPSLEKLSTIIVKVVEGNDDVNQKALLEYANISSDEDEVIQYQQEKLATTNYDSLVRTIDFDNPDLQKEISSCEQSLCGRGFRDQCPQNDPNNVPAPEFKPGDGGM